MGAKRGYKQETLNDPDLDVISPARSRDYFKNRIIPGDEAPAAPGSGKRFTHTDRGDKGEVVQRQEPAKSDRVGMAGWFSTCESELPEWMA